MPNALEYPSSPRLSRSRRSALGVALALVSLLVVACGNDDPGRDFTPPPIPDPALDTLESAVAEALRADRAALVEDPSRAAAWGRFGQTLHVHDLRREAAVCYGAAAALAPLEERWPYLEARALQPVDLDAALAAFERVVALRPRNSAIYLAHGEALLEAGRSDEAIEPFETALEQGGNDAFAYFGLARAQLLGGDLEAAAQAVEKALQRRSDLATAHTLSAQIAQRQGDAELAQKHLWIASGLEGSPAPDDSIFAAMAERGVSAVWERRRGLAALRSNRPSEAEEAFRRVLEAQPESAADHAHLGAALVQQDRVDEALAVYRRGLELDQPSASLHNNYAQALLQTGDLDAADGELAAALAIAPTDLEARLNQAVVATRRSDLGAALAILEAALEIAPGDARVLEQLAPRLARAEPERAIELWERLLSVAPERLEALDALAQVLANHGRHDRAIGWLRRGLDVAPNSSRLNLLLAWHLATAPDAASRHGEEAVRLARRVRRAYPEDPQAADVLAAALAESGDLDGAVTEALAAADLARRKGIDPTPILRRLESYRAGRPHHQPAIPRASLAGARSSG